MQKIIQESVNKNPLGIKEALEEELRARVALALEAKMSEMHDDEDEDDELDEAVSFQSVLKAHEYAGNGKDYTWSHGRTKVTHYGDHAVSYNDADGRKVHKTPSHLNKHLNALHDNEVNMRSLKESFDLDEEALDFVDSMLDEGYDLDDAINAIVKQELEEGSIKGSGTDRKAQLKKAYRAGEQKTRNFYKNKFTSAPKTADKGVKKAFAAGTNAGDGSPTAQGSKRSSSQDSLKSTKHDQSSVSPTSKSFRSTHSSKMYGLRKKPNLPESFDLSDYTVEELEDFMMSEEFDQLDEISMEKLKAYHKAAKGDADTRSIKQAEGDGGRGNIKKFLNRKRGMEIAVRKAGKKVMGESFNLSDYTVEELKDFMMSEDFDQLDEISKKTLASYVKKAGGAGKEGLAHAVKSQMSAADSADRAGYKKSQRQANNRSTGIQRAADKLAK